MAPASGGSAIPEPSDTPHARVAAEVLAALGSSSERGLSARAVIAARARFGPNRLREAAAVPPWRRFLGQFRELVIWILIAAAGISILLGEWADTVAILAIVLLNAILGFVQEERAARAIESLRSLATPVARALREGTLRPVPADELVPGDRIEVEAGDRMPADARLIAAFGFRTQESALTGESTPVDKDPGAILPADTALGDRVNMVYLGTLAASGKASAVVTATGMSTELGRIAGMLERIEPRPTPLQRRLAELGRILVFVCLAIVAGFSVLQLARGGALLEVLLLSVSLAVAAVPEGLPAVVTVALALGLQRLVRRNALVRTLPSVETLGSVTVICSDKTGTLTRNEMTVREIVTAAGPYRVTGGGYAPQGGFLRGGAAPARPGEEPTAAGGEVDPRAEPDLLRALRIGAGCNNARLLPGEAGQWSVIGDPTEGALLVAALKAGVEGQGAGVHAVYEIPFDAERRAMSVALRDPGGAVVLYAKGAPEAILPSCVAEWAGGVARPLTDARRAEILAQGAALAERALRVLALASREPAGEGPPYHERDLVFAGLAGMLDPPRDEARAAVAVCRDAGIRPVMITGDHPATALAIARELGIARAGEAAVTGRDLDAMSDAALATRVERMPVYARVAAKHKLRVVRAWRARGQVVAMTGDGVNDAPAVQTADIGIAMGVTGTDVTREAADMVLLDDNFASIVAAVEEGRGIFDNIQKFVHYLLSTNAGEVLLMLFAAIAGWPLPLVAIQILWINLVTDGLPALALGLEPPERDIMRRAPQAPRAPVLTLADGVFILVRGSLVAAAAAVAFALAHGGDPAELGHARAIAFCVTAYAQLLYAFAFRSRRRTLPELGLFSNPALLGAVVIAGLLQFGAVAVPFARPFFEVARPLGADWLLVAALAVAPVTLVEAAKIVRALASRGRAGRSGVEPGRTAA